MLKMRIPILLLSIVALLTACGEEDDPVQDSISPPGSVNCSTFSYADTLFFLREQATDYIESTTSSLAGTFGAFPEGLVIDPNNGDINITQSESGVKYEVFYVPTGATDTCKANVTISGINYLSGVRVLSENDTLATPFLQCPARPSASLF